MAETISFGPECDVQRIEEFLRSSHYKIEDAELITHLDSCNACRQHMEQIAAEDSLKSELAQLLQPNEFDTASDPACSAAPLPGQQCHPSATVQDAIDSLTPSEDPQHLGRIGNYEVTGVIGVGAMGVVLKAIDPSLDRVVAVKLMAPRLANNETARKRFLREAKAAAAVLHPNVIPIHSVQGDSKIPYLVMSYIRGGSLQKRLQSEGPLPLLETLRIGSQIAAGLQAAHEQGLVHRDIKPENILSEEGVERVTITDFGLARAVDDNTVTQYGAIAGTPMYMSPEQARGEQVDQQSDLFSLGSVLYVLATGRPPFQAETSYGVMRRIIDEQATPIGEWKPEIPDWFSQIVSRLMAKEKTTRYQTASQVHRLLEECLSHVQQPDLIQPPVVFQSQEAEDDPTQQSQIEQHRLPRNRLGLGLLGALAITCIALAVQFGFGTAADKNKPLMVGAGVSNTGDGWFVSTGNLYLHRAEPGVMFGLYEDPTRYRNFSYVILFRHEMGKLPQVSTPKDAGMSFDGRKAVAKDGITVDGNGFVLDLEMQMNHIQIESFKLAIDEQNIDLAKGQVFLIDLTKPDVPWVQVSVPLYDLVVDPIALRQDTDAVKDVAKQLLDVLPTQSTAIEEFVTDNQPLSKLLIYEEVFSDDDNRIGGQ